MATDTQAQKHAGKPSTTNSDRLQLWRLPTILERVPVSRSTWIKGVKAGRYPAPVRIGERAIAWRVSDIEAVIDSLA